MSARIIHLGLYNAYREVEDACAQVRAASRIVSERRKAESDRLKADADRRRVLIEAHLQRIENDVEHSRPSDSEAAQ